MSLLDTRGNYERWRKRRVLDAFDPGEERDEHGRWTSGGETSFPKAGDKVDGLTVREDIPNLGSISAGFDEGTYDELPGIREVPFSAFEAWGNPSITDRTKALAEQIKESGEINPLIVVIESYNLKAGPYILEGGHRFDALQIAGKKSFPALVIIEHGKQTKDHVHDASPARRDPTGTGPLRGKFRNDLDRRWAKLRTLTAEALAQANILGLGAPTVATIVQAMRPASQHVPLPGIDKVQGFQRWFDEALRQVVLGNDGGWTRTYVDQAWQAATDRAEVLVGRRVGDAGSDDEPRDERGRWTNGGDIPGLKDIRSPDEDVEEVVSANFTHGRVVGNETVPIETLYHGTSQGDDPTRITKLVSKISSPEGYFSRPIVDDEGSVVEGQHRLAALKLLGAKEVPIVRVKDLERGQPIKQMRAAILAQGKIHPDHVHQIIGQVLGMIDETGSAKSALSEYDFPKQYAPHFKAALGAAMAHHVGDAAPTVDRLPVLRSVTVSELQGIMEATSQQAVRAVAEGLMLRQRSAKIARAVAARIEVIGKSRSRLMANHMVVKTFSVATLDAYRAMGIGKVGTRPEALPKIRQTKNKGKRFIGDAFDPELSEFLRSGRQPLKLAGSNADVVEVLTTSNDPCPICEDISDGGPYDLDEAESLIPAHPHCLCVYIPAYDSRFGSVREED